VIGFAMLMLLHPWQTDAPHRPRALHITPGIQEAVPKTLDAPPLRESKLEPR
jgi:hypothetical protein